MSSSDDSVSPPPRRRSGGGRRDSAGSGSRAGRRSSTGDRSRGSRSGPRSSGRRSSAGRRSRRDSDDSTDSGGTNEPSAEAAAAAARARARRDGASSSSDDDSIEGAMQSALGGAGGGYRGQVGANGFTAGAAGSSDGGQGAGVGTGSRRGSTGGGSRRQSETAGGVAAEEAHKFLELDMNPFEAGVGNIEVHDSDCEPEPLKPGHVIDYVGGGSDQVAEGRGDQAGAAQAAPGANREVVFVESAATRQFKRFHGNVDVITGASAKDNKFTSRLAKATHSNDGPQQPPAPLNAPITRIVEAVYMLCQGMLPGVALANLVMASVYPERTLFDASFPAVAGGLRQIMYILATISWLGSMASLTRHRDPKLTTAERENMSLTLVQVTIVFVCYTVTVLLGLFSSPIDNRIFEAVEGISAGALLGWRVLGALSFGTSLVAWAILCAGAYHEAELARAAVKKHKQYELALAQAEESLSRLSGLTIDRMGLQKLEVLHEEHKALLEKTTAALEQARAMHLGTTHPHVKGRTYESATGDDGSSIVSGARSEATARSRRSQRSTRSSRAEGESKRSGRAQPSYGNRRSR